MNLRLYFVCMLHKRFGIYALTRNEASFVGGNTVKNVAFDGSYTFTTAEALGIEIENFRCWTDGTNYYKAGETVALAKVQYKLLKPFCQDASLPAVSFKFEGDAALGGSITEGNGNAKFNINGIETVVYGKAAAASLYETALAVKNANGQSYINNKTYIDFILAE